ncbi:MULTISPECIES: ABC transporter ATP-binding protein [unclassified Duganella]|uniref:ABC transporter ATP-binding protein n=1 Tax=unclassified Duganella TaxID=2636909 RepID=UPI000889DF22|nr:MULTISPECIES: ABC transporter ATP-binding protein [unclassified Duganella]SDG06295.1 NitT/TauT family transport system ATP-binding protein [Duganella sp. OV458]SDI98957.1 NitT/TauT family transport system ATP-binding protein [Duganella sp. OV510]
MSATEPARDAATSGAAAAGRAGDTPDHAAAAGRTGDIQGGTAARLGTQPAPRSANDGWALHAERLSFAYGGASNTFADITLGVRPREIVALLGGSGCGKSTLLRVLAGLLPPSAGAVQFLGAPLTEPNPRSALVFQQASLLPWLNVTANVGFGLDFARQPKITRQQHEQRVQDAITAVGLAGNEKRYPAALSGGMAQRVALARALARQPELLFADEPFSALDAITRADMQTLLVDVVHRWHTAALLVTHDIDEALLVADRIVLMGGRPGAIVREWQVDLPRPRLADSDALGKLRLDILAALQGVSTTASTSTESTI